MGSTWRAPGNDGRRNPWVMSSDPTVGPAPLGRHRDPRHLVTPIRLLLTDRDESLIGDGWRRWSPPPPVGDRPPDAPGPAHAVGGQLLFEATSCGVTDGHLVAPEQQRRLLGREQLGHERGRVPRAAGGRPRRPPPPGPAPPGAVDGCSEPAGVAQASSSPTASGRRWWLRLHAGMPHRTKRSPGRAGPVQGPADQSRSLAGRCRWPRSRHRRAHRRPRQCPAGAFTAADHQIPRARPRADGGHGRRAARRRSSRPQPP